MDYQLVANIFLAFASYITLAVMLKWDLIAMQENEFSNKNFMNWLQSCDESFSVKRIIPMAVLVGSATTWARQSWSVVLILAATMLVLAIVMLFSKHEKHMVYNRRAITILVIVLAVVAACATSLYTAHFSLEAAMLVLLFTAFSYVLTMGANIIAKLFFGNNNNTSNNTQQNQ